jgi:electron transport complex protein RnfG
MREVFDLAWRLLLICVLSAGSLAGVYEVTADRIQENRQRQKIEMLKKVLPAAERFEAVDKGDLKYEVGYRGEERVGGVVYVTEKGYGGPVQVMVGIDKEGKVVEVLLLSHKETPGLGTKVANLEFRSQFLGKSGPFSLRKDDPAGNIDAVASATISSRAVTKSVDRALKQFQQEWGKHG